MNGSQLWLAAATLQALMLLASCAHHRRIMASQASLPSKGGWRPVVSSNGLVYGSYASPSVHSPSYKIPVPVLDLYQSSARPAASRDQTKLTTIAQSYRPTTLRNTAAPPAAPVHQPINSYHNPFQIQNNGLASLQNNGYLHNNGLSYFKHVQNYPLDSVLIRNPHNPYAARPVFSKYPTKFKQQSLQNNVLQQLTSIQPIQFGQYQTQKPQDVFAKPVESYVKPTDNKKHTETEIMKQEMYKLQDSDTASQSVSQQVKTAQQQNIGLKNPVYTFPQYTFQEAVIPPSLYGSFGSFGVQSVKGRDPIYPSTKTTFLPPQSSKQTVFNSFSYSPSYKPTTAIFSGTTPRILTTPLNQAHFSTTYNEYKITPTPSPKVSPPPKIDPNADLKETGGFKPSPNDPYYKFYQSDYNKVTPTTYKPSPTTSNNVYEYSYQAQNPQNYDQQNLNYNFDKHKVHDSITAGGHQHPTKQYVNKPVSQDDEDSPHHEPAKPTYEVIETTESDVITHSQPPSWVLTSQPNEYTLKSTEGSAKLQEYSDSDYGRPNTTPSELPEEYAIVTEAEKGYENSLGYDGPLESQSRRPLGDDFEPIGKQRLKDYYSYKVSTPSYDDYSVTRRTKKPEATRNPPVESTTTAGTTLSGVDLDTLPTLPPSQHFKRPTTPLPTTGSQGNLRKRTKIRRRRPSLAQLNRNRDEASTHGSSTTTETAPTESTETHTIKPRTRPSTSTKPQTPSTTPTVSTDLTTSAVPTISPTSPSIVKKKLIHRRPITSTSPERSEVSTISTFKIYETKESPIMKIANRQNQSPRATLPPFDFRLSEAPDYTHKQDEKDTPTSDVSVNLKDAFKTTAETEQEFAFHKDVKPIDAKLEPVTNRFRETTTDSDYNEVTTFAPRQESSTVSKVQRPRLRNKYNRPKFSVKDYKSRLSSTTSTTEKVENTPTNKVRFPLRRTTESPFTETDTTTERRKFTPKDPRYKANTESETEREPYTVRQTTRQRQTTQEAESTTQKISSRIRNSSRRKPVEESTETITTIATRRPLRKKIKDSEISESVQELSVTDTTLADFREPTSERTRSESAIMKIADKKHQDHIENLFEHSKRVSDLTLAASKDYNKPGMFKSVSSNSRRIPNYFTIATDDPILPIEAFFPQLNQKKET